MLSMLNLLVEYSVAEERYNRRKFRTKPLLPFQKFVDLFLLQAHLYRNEIRSASGGAQRELSKGARGIVTIMSALTSLLGSPAQKGEDRTNKRWQPRRRAESPPFIVLRNGREEAQGRERPLAQPQWGAQPKPSNEEEAAKRGLDGGPSNAW